MTMTRTARARALAGAATVALLAAPALAQTADPSAASGAEAVETVVVRGARPIQESDRAALIVQREAPALVSVLSADEAGRLADQNVAAAIGRLPGVGLERDQGQARYANLRGQPRRWANISIDGLGVVSPEGRDTRLDTIPTAIASRIVINKAVTPDMPGDTIAGAIDVRTRTAFDHPGRRISGQAIGGLVRLGGGEELDFNLVASDRFFDDRLGILAQAAWYRRNMVTDNWETDPYLRPGGTIRGASGPSGVDRRPGSETRRWAREHENKPYRLTRGNLSGSLRADFRPNDMDRLFAQTVYTEFTDRELRNNYIFRLDRQAATVSGPCPTTPAPVTTSTAYDVCTGSTPEKGVVYGAEINANFRSGRIKEYIWTSTIGGDHERFGWNLAWRLNMTETEDGQDELGRPVFRSPSSPALRPTVEYDFTDDTNHTLRLFRTVVTGGVRSRGDAVTAIESFPLDLVDITSIEGGDFTRGWTGRVDASREWEVFGLPTEAKLGVFATTRTKKARFTNFRATPADFARAGRPVLTFADIALPNKEYLGDLQLGYTFQYYSETAVERLFDELLAAGIARQIDTTTSSWRVTEEILAGYAMATVTRDWGSIVFGARVERTTNDAEGWSVIGAARRLVAVQSDDVLIFPSAHVNVDLNDDMKLRLSLSTGSSRPDFDELVPNFVVDDGPGTIAGGNPEAKPERAIGLDAYWEWYMRPQGFLTIGLYYKDIRDALFTQTSTFGLDVLNDPTRDRSGYTLTSVRNGGAGHLAGLEIGWHQFAEELVARLGLPEWTGGFGLRFSATFNEGKITVPGEGGVPTRTVPLPGASDMMFNLALVYEKHGLSTRLAWQHRTPWLQSVGAYAVFNDRLVPDGNGDIYWNSKQELDLSVRYRMSKAFELTFDAVNLLDSPGRRHADGAANPIEYEKFGRRYLAGVRFTF
jgi:TonB-dependent receptor